jgi:hypothetical protein
MKEICSACKFGKWSGIHVGRMFSTLRKRVLIIMSEKSEEKRILFLTDSF